MVIAVALIVVPSASAAFSITRTTGTPLTVTGITLSGIDQTKPFTVVMSVVNTGGGNGAGWNETASATIPTSGANVLPALILTAVSATGGAPNPTNSVTYPITILTTPLKVFNAALTTGKGTMAVTHTFTMTYPSNVLPATYSSVITFTAALGP